MFILLIKNVLLRYSVAFTVVGSGSQWCVTYWRWFPYRPPTDRSSYKKSTIFSSSYLRWTIVCHIDICFWDDYTKLLWVTNQTFIFDVKEFFFHYCRFCIVLHKTIFVEDNKRKEERILENVLNVPHTFFLLAKHSFETTKGQFPIEVQQ